MKIIDINGTIKYSNIIKITLPDIKGTITISPNPVSTELRSAIVATTSSNVTWQVIDSKGSTVLQGNAVFNKGNNKLSINTSQLSSGSYYLRITGSDKEIKASFQKL
ncbi:MAG: T9SS type A sorting domain-containing protein [Ferruginibacter sp.]